ncbi:Protein fmp32, mitochondrial [Malassezia obtusa]|uniref:Protein fmp32, mitochondrial n=1 Tax=Malassezia obtusa TaxID=76774 RepID=A0AAF0E0N4_9BASI|nr:Protein fmp32, mitochondrial [Malassezia obtusa]
MGKSGSGKTSMRSFIFSSYRSEDTKRLGSTIEVEHSHVRFPGSLVLNLWDCGGQKSYMESYMDTQRSQVFSAVGVLIYVVDLVNTDDDGGDSHEWEADLRYFRDCLSALQSNSPGAEVFCLLHKMDLIEPSLSSNDDDSEDVLLEGLSDSMLPDSRRVSSPTSDDRYERISELVKHFKISCLESHHQIQGLELRTQTFAAYLDVLTSSTYILVIVTDPAIRTLGVRNVHFDTNAFVQRLEQAGIQREQADVLVTALIDVINESLDNFSRGLVRRDEADRLTYTQKVDFAKLKSEIQLLERSDFVLMKSENERLMADVEKLKQRLREEITRTTAGVRLDLNLEKGRIRDESSVHALKIKEVDTRIESEIAGVRTSIQSAKFNVLQYLVGVATGAGALLLAYLRMFR